MGRSSPGDRRELKVLKSGSNVGPAVAPAGGSLAMGKKGFDTGPDDGADSGAEKPSQARRKLQRP